MNNTIARRVSRFALAAGVALTLSSSTAGATAAPDPVPCSPLGGGKYSCSWYVPGNGVTGGAFVKRSNRWIGFLQAGTNWVVCQKRGAVVTDAAGHKNHWYAWTESDNDRGPGWASALEAAGGDDFGSFRGVPDCGRRHGAAPRLTGAWRGNNDLRVPGSPVVAN